MDPLLNRLGIKPDDVWILWYCLALFTFFALCVLLLGWQTWRLGRRSSTACRLLAAIPTTPPEEERFGRNLESIERIRAVGQEIGADAQPWWLAVDRAIERYDSPEPEAGRHGPGYFVTQPVSELISYDAVAGGYASIFFRSIPGVISSLGLLGTFSALFVGLRGLGYNEQSGVYENLPHLVSNLSGKFLTSIVALALSIAFLLVEASARGKVRGARERLIEVLIRRLPYLSPSRVMLDIQRHSVAQATALRNISSDVVDKFANVFRGDLSSVFAKHLSGSMATEIHTEIGPTLETLTTTMRGVSETIASLESQKHESVAGEIRGLTTALEQSMKASLQEMGRQFRDALSGSTQDEFGELAGVVKGSAEMLSQMNQGFGTMQAALQTIVDEARTNTSAQMRTGLEQTERLNALVEGLMTRLNESANQNYEQITGALTHVITELTERVQSLSANLIETVGATSAESQKAATETVRKVADWSSHTNQGLGEMIAVLHRKVEDFDRAGQTLTGAQAMLQSLLDQNRNALAAMATAANEVKAYSTSLAGLQRSIEEGQKAQTHLASQSRETVSELTAASRRHQEFLAQYDTVFQRYRGVFDGLDQQIANVLDTILTRVQDYHRSVEGNFQAIVRTANDAMPRMAGAINDSTRSLSEQLDELTDVLEKGIARLRDTRANETGR